MKLKNASEISEKLLNKLFHDSLNDQNSYEEKMSLFVKDLSLTPIKTDANKLALIIIESETGEVINNDLRFNNLVIENDLYHFIIIDNKNQNKTFKISFEINNI